MGFKSFDAGQGKRFPKILKSFAAAVCTAKAELLYQDSAGNTTPIPKLYGFCFTWTVYAGRRKKQRASD
jgi:hypothetical protein